jgi:DnaA family protein
MKQIPLPIALDAVQSFDSFLTGDNAMALHQLRDVKPGCAPVYLWGPQGCGKTHLLKATAIEKQSLGGNVGWFGPGDSPPWAFDETWGLLVLDDCDEFNAAQQQAAFALFVEATNHCVPVVAAGRVPPVDLPLRDDLRSRLGWGHVLALQSLTEAQSRGALRREADRRGLLLSDEVIDHLLHRYARDLKHLMNQLDRLDEFALIHKRAVTVPLLRQMLMETHDNSPIGGPP